jgi:hypothetical protein
MSTAVAAGNVHVFERMATRDRMTGMNNGAPIFARGTLAAEAEKILKERIEAGKERYGSEAGRTPDGSVKIEPAALSFSHVALKDGWVCAEAIYASKQRPMVIHAIVEADGSVAGY